MNFSRWVCQTVSIFLDAPRSNDHLATCI